MAKLPRPNTRIDSANTYISHSIPLPAVMINAPLTTAENSLRAIHTPRVLRYGTTASKHASAKAASVLSKRFPALSWFDHGK